MRVSIVTPSFNQVDYLEATIRSVLDQRGVEIEYILMDGGSTDGSVDILRKYAGCLAYWVSEPDQGQADAINRGFARASGDILGWLNSDDLYEPDALRAVVDAFAQNPAAGIVYGEGWYIDSTGQRIRPCRFVKEHFDRRLIANKDPILQQAAFWRRSVWERVGPLDPAYNWVFDWEWFARAFGVGVRFHYLPRFLGSYRVHAAAKTRSSDIRRRSEQRQITLRYGRWWHPNALVQSARIAEARFRRYLGPLAALPRLLAERAFYGMYTT